MNSDELVYDELGMLHESSRDSTMQEPTRCPTLYSGICTFKANRYVGSMCLYIICSGYEEMPYGVLPTVKLHIVMYRFERGGLQSGLVSDWPADDRALAFGNGSRGACIP